MPQVTSTRPFRRWRPVRYRARQSVAHRLGLHSPPREVLKPRRFKALAIARELRFRAAEAEKGGWRARRIAVATAYSVPRRWVAGPLRGRSPDASAHHLVSPKTTLILAPRFRVDLRAQAELDASEKLAVAAKRVAKQAVR